MTCCPEGLPTNTSISRPSQDANDLPLEEYCAGIERVLLGLLSANPKSASARAS